MHLGEEAGENISFLTKYMKEFRGNFVKLERKTHISSSFGGNVSNLRAMNNRGEKTRKKKNERIIEGAVK